MTDTALNESEPVELADNLKPPILDLDAMLADLHNEFSGEPDQPKGRPEDDEDFALSKPYTGTTHDGAGSSDLRQAGDSGTESADAGGSGADAPDLDGVLPPGYVQFGEEVLPQEEVRALLELNRRVKNDPSTASRVRTAILGEQETPTTPAAQVDPDALPAWLDPDDQQNVFLYRQQQRIDRELAELREQESRRVQTQAQERESQRVTEVRDAFRVSMKEFRDEHPGFNLEDLNAIANRAANMGLLEHPEKVGGTLKGGIVTALETAMWATPEYRDKAVAGATVRTKEQQSANRKQKSSALSSSTGSVVRTQSQEKTPTTRKEVMAGALDFLRSGGVSD